MGGLLTVSEGESVITVMCSMAAGRHSCAGAAAESSYLIRRLSELRGRLDMAFRTLKAYLPVISLSQGYTS